MTLYILDTNTLSTIFRFYYRNIFVSFWSLFDELLASGNAISVRQVRAELERRPDTATVVSHLLNRNPGFFADNAPDEIEAVGEFVNSPLLATAVSGWTNSIDPDEPTRADPYLVAKAMLAVSPAAVVTQESRAPHLTSRIPYVCRQLGVRCMDLEGMLTDLGWRF